MGYGVPLRTEYKITINMYNETSDYGTMKIAYYIGGTIETNKAFVVTIEDNTITDILYSIDEIENELEKSTKRNVDLSSIVENTDEQSLNLLVEEYKEANKEQVPSLNSVYKMKRELDTEVKVSEIRENFYYDYTTQELTYIKSTYLELPELGGIIVDETEEVNLN